MTEGAKVARNATLHREPQSRLGRIILYRSIARAIWRQDAKLGSILLQARPLARELMSLDLSTGVLALRDPSLFF